MQYIPIITLVLVVILLGLVIVLLTRKPEKPELPQQIDPTASITALGTLVTQNLREGREAQSNQLSAMDKSLGDKMSGLTDQLGRFETRLQGFTAETTQNLTNIRETVDKNLHTFTGETKQNLETIRSTMDKNLHTFTGETKQDLETIRETVDKNLHTFTGETKQDLENIRVTVDKNLRAMQEDNNKKLDDMRQIVDEKLQKTLSERMNESFKLVNERLEQVYKGLGEMQTLAQGVGDLKKVLTNVKTRGIVGEIQLGAILEDILAPEQYETNVATVPNSRNVVEYAVKLPVEDGSFVWLLDATDTDPAQVVLLAKANPQSAFGLLADPSALTEDCVKTLAACRNLVVMPLMQTPELTPEVCRAARRLKAQKMFYVLTVLIDDETAGEVMQDDWLESMAQETLCCMCARKPGTSDETARKLRRSIVNGRLETGKPVLLLDWDGDVRYLNNRISEYMTFGSVLPEGSTFPLQLG